MQAYEPYSKENKKDGNMQIDKACHELFDGDHQKSWWLGCGLLNANA